MKETMLIVDDREINRTILCETFQGEYRVLEAESAEEALEILKEQHKEIKIILLDLMLTGMSGFEFLEIRKKTEYLKEIPVVIITGSNHMKDQIRGFDLGADEYITKPFQTEIVKVRVNNVISNRHHIRTIEKEVEQLKLKAEIDEMTGLSNKASTEAAINEVLLKGGGHLDVLMIIDVDHFKTVNDTLGHQVGDRVIKIIANVVFRLMRQTDIVGRIGGDEFCVLMRDVPNMDIVYAKLRELHQLMKYKPGLAIPEFVTLSIGIASNNRKKTTYSNLFHKADEALYGAKQGGKAQYREYGVDDTAQLAEDTSGMAVEPEDLVLIVDDEPVSRKILRKILQDRYSIREAENGAEAMKQIRENEDRLMAVVLDLTMPIMNGYQVLEQMKRSNHLKSIPIIISTVDGSEDSDLKTLNLGADLIAHKPVNAALIHKQIDNLVSAYKERKTEIKQYLLQKTLIGNRSNTFLCTYYFDTNKVEIGESYLKYVGEDFSDIFVSYPFHVENFVLPADYKRTKKFFDVTENRKGHEEIEVKFKVDTACYEWFEINKVVKFDEKHQVESVIFMFLNIEYAMEAKQNLLFMAANDVLTHIPNMRTFYDDVAKLLNQYPQESFLMVTMDIFQFQIVNKLFGHKEGDSVIKYVATKLQEMIEEFDYGAYCRASSDIFYICIAEKEDIGDLMQMMQHAMCQYPLKFQIKLCFGIYRIADRRETVENMIEHSDFARKKAKEAPVKSFQYYDRNLQQKETFELVALAEMEDALKSSQFEVYYQPKCDIQTSEIVGAEALIRWNHPEKGYLSPAFFIPVFEQNGTCVELDYYVYDQVCRMIKNCLDKGEPVVPVSVNVSRWSLYNEDLAKNIIQIVENYHIPHEYIEFEITESAFVLEAGLLTAFSQGMREHGFRILIDDFGSGYSSLNSLKDISVDVLKIDIKFLPVSREEKKAEIVLSSVISMGQRLGLDVIAEGVETEEQVILLKALGCRYVQGYYFYRPMPYAEFQKLFSITRDYDIIHK